MADIPYKTWALLPRDLEPLTQEPVQSNPPLMTNVALDMGASLQYDLQQRSDDLTALIRVTAMGAEGRADGFLQVFTGEVGALRQVTPEWSRSQDGPTVIFRLHIGAGGPCVKVHLPAGATLVVTGMDFEG